VSLAIVFLLSTGQSCLRHGPPGGAGSALSSRGLDAQQKIQQQRHSAGGAVGSVCGPGGPEGELTLLACYTTAMVPSFTGRAPPASSPSLRSTSLTHRLTGLHNVPCRHTRACYTGLACQDRLWPVLSRGVAPSGRSAVQWMAVHGFTVEYLLDFRRSYPQYAV
jgi:hypothetical protein